MIGFAHRGARAVAPENTLAAFSLALALGATGLESDVWLTADGLPVLHHGARVKRAARARWAAGPGRWTRSTPISALTVADLPGWLPSLADLLRECGTAYDLSLDLPDRAAAAAVLSAAREAGGDLDRLWLCGRGLQPIAWRALDPDVRLVADTRRRHLDHGWPAYLDALAAGGVDAVNLRSRRVRGPLSTWGWSASLVAQVHDAGLLAFGWGAHSAARLQALIGLGCDAVYSDEVATMTAMLAHPKLR